MSEVFDETESPIPLTTPADCERAMARLLRQIHKGTLDTKKGHCLVIGIGTLAKMLRESAEYDALERLDRLERKNAEPPRADPQAH